MRNVFVMMLVMAIIAIIFVMPASAAEASLGAIGLHTVSGDTYAGVCLGLSIIPDSETNSLQSWASRHITLDILQVGNALDATSASLGVSANLLAPEGNLKLGATYLFNEREPAVYLGYSFAVGD